MLEKFETNYFSLHKQQIIYQQNILELHKGRW